MLATPCGKPAARRSASASSINAMRAAHLAVVAQDHAEIAQGLAGAEAIADLAAQRERALVGLAGFARPAGLTVDDAALIEQRALQPQIARLLQHRLRPVQRRQRFGGRAAAGQEAGAGDQRLRLAARIAAAVVEPLAHRERLLRELDGLFGLAGLAAGERRLHQGQGLVRGIAARPGDGDALR